MSTLCERVLGLAADDARGPRDQPLRPLVTEAAESLGRGLEPFDSPTVEQISRHVSENGHRFSVLVQEIVKSDPFQMRSSDGGKQ